MSKEADRGFTPGTYIRKSWWVSVLCFFGLHIMLEVIKRGDTKRFVVCPRCQRWQQHELLIQVHDGVGWGELRWQKVSEGRTQLPPARVESDELQG